MVYYTTYVVHTKIFFWDFDNDSYAQNSEIILTIRIQKNFFKIPIGKFFEKLSKSKKKNLCVPHMWYSIPHLWVKVTTYVVYYTTYVVYYTTNVYSPEIPILIEEHSVKILLQVRRLYQPSNTLGLEPISIVHYTRPGSSIKQPTSN